MEEKLRTLPKCAIVSGIVRSTIQHCAMFRQRPCYPVRFTLVRVQLWLAILPGAIELRKGGEEYGLSRGSTNC